MRASRRGRAGVVYLEVQVAMVVLGIGLAGLCPLAVMQMKLLNRLETPDPLARTPRIIRGVRMVDGRPILPARVGAPGNLAAVPLIVQPQPDAWQRRLGVPATIGTTPTSQTPLPTPRPRSVAVGDPGFSAEGWASAPTGGARARSHGDATTSPATWDFTGVVPGYYRVVASWPVDPATPNATDATFTIRKASTATGTEVRVNLDDAPPAAFPGVFYLGETPRVELGVSETGRVVAGSIEVIPMMNQVQVRGQVVSTGAGFGVTVEVTPP